MVRDRHERPRRHARRRPRRAGDPSTHPAPSELSARPHAPRARICDQCRRRRSGPSGRHAGPRRPVARAPRAGRRAPASVRGAVVKAIGAAKQGPSAATALCQASPASMSVTALRSSVASPSMPQPTFPSAMSIACLATKSDSLSLHHGSAIRPTIGKIHTAVPQLVPPFHPPFRTRFRGTSGAFRGRGKSRPDPNRRPGWPPTPSASSLPLTSAPRGCGRSPREPGR